MFKCRKFEEIYPPEVAEFVYITDDTYTKKQVLRMEHLVLKVLSFDLAAPTINQFLTQYFLHQSVNKCVENLAMVSKGAWIKEFYNFSKAITNLALDPKNLWYCVIYLYKLYDHFIFSPQYLGELSLVDSDPFLKYLPSQTAAAAYVLANNTVTGGSWVSLK